MAAHRENLTGVSPCLYCFDSGGGFGYVAKGCEEATLGRDLLPKKIFSLKHPPVLSRGMAC